MAGKKNDLFTFKGFQIKLMSTEMMRFYAILSMRSFLLA